MARAKPQISIPYLALLVGVISLLGVVFLTLKVASPDTGAALAGEAAGGGAQLPANQQCIWKSVGDGLTTGNKVCQTERGNDQNLMFKNCEFALQEEIIVLYDSDDGSCSGKAQLGDEEFSHSRFKNCGTPVQRRAPEPCSIEDRLEFTEPMAGDVQVGETGVKVLCCR